MSRIQSVIGLDVDLSLIRRQSTAWVNATFLSIEQLEPNFNEIRIKIQHFL